jgi:flagellar secretion chaperone FliS
MSGYQSLAHRYREVAIKTASPLQLVVMLYDAAICCIQVAREQMESKDIAGRSRSVNKCIAIISELQACLNLKAGGEIAGSLNRLYDYMKGRIFRANVEQTSQPLTEVETLLENLRSAWVELVSQAPATAIPPATSPQRPNDSFMGSASATPNQTKSLNISI